MQKAKGSSGPPPKKVVFDLGASANVLTTNKDCNLMAVAGRKCECATPSYNGVLL